MNKAIIITAISLILGIGTMTSCNSQSSNQTSDTQLAKDQEETSTIWVYYFHGDRRCATCKAVGRVSKETLAENYSENENIIYIDLNVDDPANAEITDKFELSGSGLFVYDGNQKTDLTVFAFQKAASKPEELKQKITETIEEML